MDMNVVGWIFIGLLAGSISGWFVRSRNPQGCIATILVGIVGGVIGGWLSQALGLGTVEGFIGAVVFATAGSILVRLVLNALEGGRR